MHVGNFHKFEYNLHTKQTFWVVLCAWPTSTALIGLLPKPVKFNTNVKPIIPVLVPLCCSLLFLFLFVMVKYVWNVYMCKQQKYNECYTQTQIGLYVILSPLYLQCLLINIFCFRRRPGSCCVGSHNWKGDLHSRRK